MVNLAKYKAYPEYKDSGVEFLPALPFEWEISRVKKTLDLQRVIVGKKSFLYQLLSLTLKGVIPRDISNGEGKIPESFDTYQIVNENDIVFCLFDMDETPRTVGIAKNNGMITGAYNVYKVNATGFPKFIYYYYLHLDYYKGLRPFYTGLRKVVRSDTFANIKIPLPPLVQQTQIASFLDHETAKIDLLIEKQQKLIELLKEKRQAVISHAVTKGLNPNVKMKDSGIEWLGEVPEHWEVCALKYCLTLNPKKSNLDGKQIKKTCSFLPMEKLKLNSLMLDETRCIKEVYNGYTYFENNDVLVAKVTPCFENMNMAVACQLVNNIGFGSSEIYVLRANDTINNYYLLYRLQEDIFMQSSTSSMTGAGGLKRVPSDFINSFAIALPDMKEQNRIVHYLNEQIKLNNKLIQKANHQIKLIQERRTALISAAVTGKIDIRDWQAPTPSALQA